MLVKGCIEIGRKKMRDELTTEHVQILLKDPRYTVREIAKMFKLSEYYVRKVKKNMQLG